MLSPHLRRSPTGDAPPRCTTRNPQLDSPRQPGRLRPRAKRPSARGEVQREAGLDASWHWQVGISRANACLMQCSGYVRIRQSNWETNCQKRVRMVTSHNRHYVRFPEGRQDRELHQDRSLLTEAFSDRKLECSGSSGVHLSPIRVGIKWR
jgi:hypothetical protein